MAAPADTATARLLNRKERDHLDALETRLTHLRDDRPDRHGDPAYPPGEANALAWAINVIRGIEEPLDLRVERLDRTLRQLQAKVGRIEHDLLEEVDD